MTLQDLDVALRGLLTGKNGSLHLTFNDGNGVNYMTVEEWLESGGPGCDTDWISEEERTKGIATNSMWEIQWYPNNPSSFEALAASSLEALVQHVTQIHLSNMDAKNR